MAGATLTTADKVLKDDYKDLREQINQKFFILSQIERNTEDVVGRRALHAIHTTRNSGVGARADGGALPTAGNQGYSDTYVPVRYNYGRIQLTGPVIRAMASDRGSFVRALRSEMDGLDKDLRRDVNRQVWGRSDGVIATCGTTSSSTTVQLATTTTPTQMRQLWADGGMVVDIGTVADPVAVATGRTVTGYNASALTITISGAAVSTTNGTHFVFRTGNGGVSDNSGVPNDGQKELTGLQTIVDSSGYLHGITAASVPVWAAYESSNSGTNRALSETLVNTAIQETNIASGGSVKALVGSPGVSRSAANLMTSIRRNNDTVELKAGYSGIRWSTPLEGMDSATPIALTWDRDAPGNALYGLDFDSLVQYEMSDWDWMDQDGAVLSRVSGYDAYEAVYFKYHELACKQRNANFKIADITEG